MGRHSRKSLREPGAKIAHGHPFYDLIEEAYRAFDTYKPINVDVCTDCCMPKDVEADFFRSNIEELPFHYLREWFSAACATDGVRKDIWAYLLPRVLEVLAVGEEPKDVGIESSLSRFDTGNPSHWSTDQWSVLDRFQRRFLQSRFQTPDRWPGQLLDDIVCMFSRGGWPLDDLLAQVMAVPDKLLAQRLWQDWCAELGEFGDYGHIWITAFWDKAEKARMMAFYTSEPLRQRMQTLALSDIAKPEFCSKASAVFSVMERSA